MRAHAALLIVALAAGGPACLATAGAPPVAQTFETRTYTMPSGLRVAVERDDSAKIVGLAWVVEGGHGDDPPGKPGLAHFVEHLLYSLPDESGRATYARLLDLGAGDVNAKTETDRTTAFAFVRRDALDELARIFVARMGDPGRGLDEARLATERLILAEELAVVGTNGKRSVGTLLNSLSDRPFVFPWEGARAALPGITVEDVRAFIAAHYRPEKMTVVLSGAIPAGWDREFLSRLPPSLAGVEGEHRAPVRLGAAPVVARATRRPDIASAADNVLERQLWLAWPLPPASGVELVPFRLAAALASRTLTEQAQALRAVAGGEATVVASKSGNVFLWRLDLRAGADPEAARREARQVLDLIVALPVARWLTRERGQAELRLQEARVREALEMESLVTRTVRRAAIVHDAPEESVGAVVQAVIDTTLGRIANVVANNLDALPARSLLLVPADARQPGPPRGQGASAGQGLDADAESPDDAEPASHEARDVAAVAQSPGASAAQVRRLPNGLTLIVMRRPGLPFSTAMLGFHASPRPDDPPGARFAVPRSLTFKGVLGPLQRGILETARVDHDSYVEWLSMFSQATAAALDLLSSEDGAGSVTWPTPATEAWLHQLAVNDATPPARLARALRGALYAGHVYRTDIWADEVRAVRSEDVRAWLTRVRRPANAVLVVVGDVDPAAVARQVEDGLGGWSGDPSPPAAPPAPPPVRPASEARPLPVLADADPRRTWTQLQFGCFLPPARSPRDVVVGELLADVIRTDLFRRLRVEHGTSYAPVVHWSFYRGGTYVVSGAVDVDAPAATRALALVRDWLDPAGAAVPTPRAIEDARWRAARASGLRDATNAALAHRLFDAWNMGWTPASLDSYPQDLASVTPEEIAGALTACRASAVVSVLSP